MNPEQRMLPTDFNLIKYTSPRRLTDRPPDAINDDGKRSKRSKPTDAYDPTSRKSSFTLDATELMLDPDHHGGGGGGNEATENILRRIMPPRTFQRGEHYYIQEVSSCPASRTDILQLIQQLDQQLDNRGAKMTGICPVRRELFSQVFDELIRQLTIHCAERGLLLLRVRNEVSTTITALQSIYASGLVFGMQKSLAREADRNRQATRVAALENEIVQLKKQIQTEALNCRALEEKEANRLAAATRRAEDDINFLRKGHDQLKAQMEDLLNQFKSSV